MIDKINWLEPWDNLCVEPSYFENELFNEIGGQHILYGKEVKVIGRRYDCDDVLFQVFNSDFDFAVVHLTYSYKANNDPRFPRTETFKDINDWINKCMIPDNLEYTLDEEN